ncbi:hypothetical protein NKJ71_16600 [Mesorhizobium sp. M0050]|uniref:hypothetical protein n=1 Tax=Mesorhizobium sp. M0050 TaxID=2956861 RepID=UPI00333A0777
MSAQLAAIAEAAPVPGAIVADTSNDNVADDSALEEIWNKNERDNGAEREGGKFASPERKAAADAESPKGGDGGEPAGDGLTPGAGAVPLPDNWKGLQGADVVKGAWEKTPAEIRAFVAAREQELQSRLSDHGRQLSSYKPLQEIFEKNGKYFDPNTGKKLADGKVVTPAQAVEYLFNVQNDMDANPVQTILNIVDRYGVRDKIAAAFGQTVQQGESELRQEIAGLKQMLASVHNPATIDDRINQKLQERSDHQSAAEELTRLSADKPLYSEIPEVDMVEAIHKARRKLGDAASKEAVFGLAYDMAVNADPDLRAKAAAAKPAATNGAAKVEGARRAAAVNIPSTASGKGRALTEDEELAAVYERNQKG